MNPKRSEAFSTLAWVLYRLGKVQDADRAIQQAMPLSGGNLSTDSVLLLGPNRLRQRPERASQAHPQGRPGKRRAPSRCSKDAEELKDTIDERGKEGGKKASK